MASPRQRAQRLRYVQYAVLVLILLAVVLLADWAELQRAFFDWELVKEQFPRVLTVALKNTIIYTACGFTFGLVLGLVLALMRLSSVGPYRWIATGVIELFRGLPALLTIILVGFALPIAMDIRVPSVFGLSGAGILALALVGGAYMAETIRAGLQAVPKGQSEAARSLGIHETPLRSWKQALEAQGDQAFPGHGKLPPFEEELRRLRAENQRLRAERDILKKATALFAREAL